jgi:hypothetical protein
LSPDGRWLAARVEEQLYPRVPSGWRDEVLIVEAQPAAPRPFRSHWSTADATRMARVNAGWLTSLTLRWSPDSRWLPHLVPASTPGRWDVHLFSTAS